MGPAMSLVRSPSDALRRFWKMPDPGKTDLRKQEWVYFVHAPDAQPEPLIKIGRTRNLKWRVIGLQSQVPVELRLIGAIKAPAGTETIVHEIFAPHRRHGEWFAPADELTSFVASLPKGGTVKRVHIMQWCDGRGIDYDALLYAGMTRLGSGGRKKRIPMEAVDKLRSKAEAIESGRH